MIKARSPFFYFNLFFGWLAAVSACMHWALNWTLYGAYPEGAALFQTIDQMSQLTLLLAGFFAICLLSTLICEWRISRGWEPRFLETFKPGCVILEMRGSSGSHASVLIRHSDGTEETYLADRQEMKELEIDSISHLWVIGKHISRIRKIGESETDFSVRRLSKLQLMPDRSLSDSILAIIAFLGLSVGLTAVGARVMIVKEFALSSRRRMYDDSAYTLIEGSSAFTTGLCLLALGLAIIITLSVLWKRGWDASELDTGTTSYDKWS